MSIREVVTLALAGGLAALALLVACGCGGEAGRRAQLRSNNPLDRAEAIVRVYDTRDRRAAQKLVDLLDDPSSAVRMYAILALRGLTGEDFGYRYYDSEGARAASVQRWRDGVRAGIVVLRLAPPAVPPGESGPFQPDATTEGGATSRAAGGASGSR